MGTSCTGRRSPNPSAETVRNPQRANNIAQRPLAPHPAARPSAEPPVLIIGAGPAGLTAGYELSRRRVKPLVLEASGSRGACIRK